MLKKKKGVPEPPSYEFPELSEIKSRAKPLNIDFDFDDKKGFKDKFILPNKISSDLPKLSGMKGYNESAETSHFANSIPPMDMQSETGLNPRISMEELDNKFSKSTMDSALKERASKEKQIFIKIDNFKQIVE